MVEHFYKQETKLPPCERLLIDTCSSVLSVLTRVLSASRYQETTVCWMYYSELHGAQRIKTTLYAIRNSPSRTVLVVVTGSLP